MVSRPGSGKPPSLASARAGDVPEPPAELHITPIVWPAGAALHRIHLDRYAADTFNPGTAGNARFSPIADAAGKPVPTLYGGTSFNCAAMETLFHDVPYAPGLKTFDKRKLHGQVHSVLISTLPLTLADLRNVPLRKLGIERKQLIDTEKDRYRQTRLWAAATYTQHPHVQGLCWTSRQDDSAMALMLFGDRIAADVLTLQEGPRVLSGDTPAGAALLLLAEAIGVHVVAGRA